MTASTRSRFERWSGGMPLSVPVAFGAVLVIAAFATTGTMIWLNARRTPDRTGLLHAAVGSALLIGCGIVVAVCGLAGGLMLDSTTFWASIAVTAAIAAPISAGISPFSSPRA